MDDFLPSIFSVLSVRDLCYLDRRRPIMVLNFSFMSYNLSSVYFLFWEISLFSKLSIEFNFCSFVKFFFSEKFSFVF